MIEALVLILASASMDVPPAPAPCAYGIKHFIGTWRVDPSDDGGEYDSSVIEFSMAGGKSTWRQFLHFQQLDEGRWLTTNECGTVTLLSPTSPIIVARFKVLGEDRIQLERSGQIYKRASYSGGEPGE